MNDKLSDNYIIRADASNYVFIACCTRYSCITISVVSAKNLGASNANKFIDLIPNFIIDTISHPVVTELMLVKGVKDVVSVIEIDQIQVG